MMMMLLFIYSPGLAELPPRGYLQDMPERRKAMDPKDFLMCQLPAVAENGDRRTNGEDDDASHSAGAAAETEAKQIWPTPARADKKATIKLFNAFLEATAGGGSYALHSVLKCCRKGEQILENVEALRRIFLFQLF